MRADTPTSILVVDDEETMRGFLGGVLREEGYASVLVGSGPEALGELGRCGHGVLVLDMHLPGMSGQEVLRRVREEWPAVAVIVMTAYPSEEAVIECMSLGAVRFLIKPFAIDEFLRAVSGALQDRRAGTPGSDDLTVRGGFRDWVEITAPSRQEYLERLASFVDALCSSRLSGTEKEDLKIAVSEIAANAMEWGNRSDRARSVRVSYCLFPDEIVFKVEDEGPGFQPEDVPSPAGNPVAHLIQRVSEGKRAGGYGMYIVRKVMDKVIYSERGNVVIMSKALTGRRHPAGERRSVSNA